MYHISYNLNNDVQGISAAKNVPQRNQSNSGASTSARQPSLETMNRPMRGNGFRVHETRPNLEKFRQRNGFWIFCLEHSLPKISYFYVRKYPIKCKELAKSVNNASLSVYDLFVNIYIFWKNARNIIFSNTPIFWENDYINVCINVSKII